MMRHLFATAAFALVASTAVLAEDPATFEVGGLKFQRPSDWQWVPVTSPMRKAQLKVPGKSAGDAAELTFFQFGGGPAGGVEANVRRWFGQFKSKEGAEKSETKEIAGTKVTFVTTEGTFSSGMPGGPTKPLDNYALLGAIVEAKDGPIFVKMTGPSATVKAADEKFRSFVAAAVEAKK